MSPPCHVIVNKFKMLLIRLDNPIRLTCLKLPLLAVKVPLKVAFWRTLLEMEGGCDRFELSVAVRVFWRVWEFEVILQFYLFVQGFVTKWIRSRDKTAADSAAKSGEYHYMYQYVSVADCDCAD